MKQGLVLFLSIASLLLCTEVHASNGGMTMSALNLVSTDGDAARVNFGQGDHTYSMGVNDNGAFTLKYDDAELLSITEDTSEVNGLKAHAITTGDLIIGDVPQWRLTYLDTFAATLQSGLSTRGTGKANVDPAGWSTDSGLICSGLSVIVPDQGTDSFSKKFQHLPDHSQVRIVATVHFIDDFDATGYLKVNDAYVWTESHDQRNSISMIDVCGSEIYPESRFSVPIDLTLSHSEKSLSIEFGSTLEDGAEAYFGVSSVSVYLRS